MKRRQVWERDGGICQICKAPVPFEACQIDHLIPRCKGGSDDPSNLQTAHKQCNRRKRIRMDGYLTTREAAKALGCSPYRVRSYVSSGRVMSVPSTGSGNSEVLIPAGEIEALSNPPEAMMSERQSILPDPVLTVPQVAERLRVTPETVRRMLRRGDLAGWMIGGRAGYRVFESEVQAYMRRAGQASEGRGDA